MKRLLSVTLVVVTTLALAVGCGGDDSSTEGADGEAPPDAELLEGDAVEIVAVDNAFDPDAARVAAGTEVTWVNRGVNDHNVVPEDADAEWGIDTADFGPDGSGSFTFDEPGVYRYYCSIHGTLTAGMPGVLIVE